MLHKERMMDSGVLRSRGASSFAIEFPRRQLIGLILIVALVAFEIFNFDTTRYALENLLGGVSFWGISWAVILAIAFCAIDFAGLARIFTPERGADEPKAVWYLMGAWLLGATMNAVMTWWAVNLTLLSHGFGNEVLSREALLRVVPLFVAVLVWLTRILFIGAFSVAGEHIFDLAGQHRADTTRQVQPQAAAANVRLVKQQGRSPHRPGTAVPPTPTSDEDDELPTRAYERPSAPSGTWQRPAPAALAARSRR